MIAIVGLGNPGEKYQLNRHNVGHMFIDYLKSQNANVKAIKTDCFMNQSGIFVKRIIENCPSVLSSGSKEKLKIKNLVIVHDDLDIPLGKFKIQKGIGPQLHNGLESIENHLKTKDFLRVRIGVDARQPDRWIDGETYVLQDFTKEEKEIIFNTFTKIASRLKTDFLIPL